jgi:hypothetical protein
MSALAAGLTLYHTPLRKARLLSAESDTNEGTNPAARSMAEVLLGVYIGCADGAGVCAGVFLRPPVSSYCLLSVPRTSSSVTTSLLLSMSHILSSFAFCTAVGSATRV